MSAVGQFSTSERNQKFVQHSIPHIGELVGGRYRVTCRLAEGTFGHTYLAKDTHLPNCPECVIKQLKSQVDDRAMQLARRLFDTEARVLYDLGSHDQIPRLLAHFAQDGDFFLAQEFIDGYPLSDEFSPDRPWPEASIVQLLEEILEVLVFVHNKRVIHRDIKPSNLIRRRRDNKLVLIDFGAVKEVTTRFLAPKPGETDYTVAIGTVGYIPKEQLGGRPRFSSDVYAVGMIGIQALTGIHPNELVEDDQTAELRWRERITTRVHPDLVAILERMVRYDFRDRYAHAEAALNALRALPDDMRQPPPTPPWRDGGYALPQSSLPLTQPFKDTNTELELEDPTGDTPFSSTGAPQSTYAVAPSFSKTGSSQAEFLSSQPGSFAQGQDAYSVTSARPGVSSAIALTQHWLTRSWKMLVMVGGASLTLMFVRGIVASSEFDPTVTTHLNRVNEQILPEAERLIQQTQPIDDPTLPVSETTGLLTQADLARESGQLEAALNLYQEALTLNPSQVEAYWGKCAVFVAQNKAEGAMGACHDALAIDPNHAKSLWVLAQAYDQMGLNSEASDARKRAIALDPSVANP